MATPNQPLPSGGLTREEVARRDLGHTTIAPSTTRLLLAVFLTAIAAVPIVEIAVARARARAGSPPPGPTLDGCRIRCAAIWT